MPELIKNKTRDGLLDSIKGFLIFLVVTGHCIQYGFGHEYLSNGSFFDNLLFKIIYSFHMPLFMLISGYLFAFSINKRSWKENTMRKVESLLVPIFLWAVISVVLLYVFNLGGMRSDSISVVSILKRYIGSVFTGLWFLWAVFLCSLVVIIVNRLFKDNVFVYLAGLIIAFFIPDIYGLSEYKFMYPYFIIGYFYQKGNYKEKLRGIYNKIGYNFLFCAAFVLLLCFYNHDSYIYTSGYTLLNKDVATQLGIDVFRFMIGLVGSIFIILLFNNIYSHIPSWIKKPLFYLGRETMGLYIVSSYIITILLTRITYNFNGTNYWILIIESVCIVLVSLVCIKIIQQSSLLNRLLLGSRNYS